MKVRVVHHTPQLVHTRFASTLAFIFTAFPARSIVFPHPHDHDSEEDVGEERNRIGVRLKMMRPLIRDRRGRRRVARQIRLASGAEEANFENCHRSGQESLKDISSLRL